MSSVYDIRNIIKIFIQNFIVFFKSIAMLIIVFSFLGKEIIKLRTKIKLRIILLLWKTHQLVILQVS